jgi:hypothetical protein
MNFYKQPDDKSCQLVALQSVLSFYNKFLSIKDIKKDLPKHSFGNLITELAVYLESRDIKTILVSNGANVRKGNKLFFDSLKQYSSIGKYEDRQFIREYLDRGPIIVNIDWYKVKNEEVGVGSHYIVLLKKDFKLWMYDGSNFEEPKITTLEQIIKLSKNINRWKDDGMFIVCDDK